MSSYGVKIVKFVRGVKLKDIKADIQSIPIPDRRFSHFHVDLVGPLPLSNRYSHLFTIIDRSTCWAEAIPLSTTSTKDCVEAILHQWVSCFGSFIDVRQRISVHFSSMGGALYTSWDTALRHHSLLSSSKWNEREVTQADKRCIKVAFGWS